MARNVPGYDLLAVLIGPIFYKVGINDIDFKARLAGPSLQHPLGTDDLGRDLLARVLYGGRISLAVGLAVAHIGLVVLVAPGLHAPSPLGAALMAAGTATNA